jgi:serine beta-lactamase-like protein LACTB
MKNNSVHSRSRSIWILGPIVLLAIVGVGSLLFRMVTGPVLYTDQQSIPSQAHASPSPSYSQATDTARRIIRTTLAGQNQPGLSVAVSVAGNLVWAEGFGWADIESRVPVTPETKFRIGTASTLLTAIAVNKLVETGRLNLDREIQTYVPQSPKRQSPPTLRQLMTSDVAFDEEDPLLYKRCEHPVEAIQHFAPAKQSAYDWVLLSAAVETASGQPFLKFMSEQVFLPLNMNKTGAESAAVENPEHQGEPEEDAPPLTAIRLLILQPLGIAKPRLKPASVPATIYSSRLREMRIRNLSCYAGAMAFYSTPSDLVRLPQPPASFEGEFLGQQILSLKTLRDSGIVVAVTSNGANSNPSAIAQQITEAFRP